MSDLIDNSLNEKKKQKSKRIRERELSDIRKILAMPEGRRFYWKLLSRAGNFKMSYAGDNNLTNFNEGRRSMGLFLMEDLLDAKPEAFTQMQRENKSEAISSEKIEE